MQTGHHPPSKHGARVLSAPYPRSSRLHCAGTRAWLALAAAARTAVLIWVWGRLERRRLLPAAGKSLLRNVSQLGYTFRVAKKQRAVRIKEQDLQRLDKLAKKEHETVSFLIQTAIREFLDRKESRQ
jgi:hypothetical protein